MQQLTTKKMKVSQLSADPANARKHSQKNINTIIASLKKFGQQKPIVVDKSGVVRAGNGTLEAMKQLGWQDADVCVTDLMGAEATAYAIADNRTSELAEWDVSALADALEKLKIDDEALLEAAGYTIEELEEMMPNFEPGDEDDQGQLDQLEPKMVKCPKCKMEFDAREQV